MYEAPIELIMGQLRNQVDGEIFKAIQDINVQVNKDELTKALQYDRGQYDKGYADGYKEAIREFSKKLKEKLKANSNYGDIYDVVAYDCIDNLVKEMGCNDG